MSNMKGIKTVTAFLKCKLSSLTKPAIRGISTKEIEALKAKYDTDYLNLIKIARKGKAPHVILLKPLTDPVQKKQAEDTMKLIMNIGASLVISQGVYYNSEGSEKSDQDIFNQCLAAFMVYSQLNQFKSAETSTI